MKRVQAALVITVAIGLVGPTRAQEADDVVRLVRLSTIADEIGSWRDAEVTAWGRDAGAPFLTVTNLAFRGFSYRVYGASCQPAASPQDQ